MDWEYAPAPESGRIAAIKDRYLPFIDGEFVEGGGDDLDTRQPGTGERAVRRSRPSTPADVDTRRRGGPTGVREGLVDG